MLISCFFSTPLAFAQTANPTPPATEEIEGAAADGSVLNTFISGFDWVSSGLIFHTPSLLDDTIKLQDGTELAGMSQFRNIFYDIAIPLFVLITSAVAFAHISNDNTAQLRQFFRRLIFIVVLFILTPSILSYSIQFINLLNEKIIAESAYNLSTFVNDFLGGFMQIPMFQQLFGISVLVPSWTTVMELIILIISVGFLLIGFIFIVFQAVIRFIALLVLSVIFPVVLPFALSEKTENIANTYFRTWFSFLIQQPAFVLGFAIVSAMLTSILQAHNNSIGTLFVYSGALMFLGGINVFIGRIFSEGWSLMSTNALSVVGARTVNKGALGFAKHPTVKRIPVQAGGILKHAADETKEKLSKYLHKLRPNETKYKQSQLSDSRGKPLQIKTRDATSQNTPLETTNIIKKSEEQNAKPFTTKEEKSNKQKPTSVSRNQLSNATEDRPLSQKKPVIATRKTNKQKSINVKRSPIITREPIQSTPVKKLARKRTKV